MADMEEPVLAVDEFLGSEDENVVNGRDERLGLDEGTTLFVQKNLHQSQYGTLDNKKVCNVESLNDLGVDLLSKIHNLENGFARAFEESRTSSDDSTEMSKLVIELDEQIQLCLAELKQLCAPNSFTDPQQTCGYDGYGISENSDLISQKQPLRSPYQEDSNLEKELSASLMEIEKLKSDNLQKANELEALRCRQKELETQISSMENEKHQLEENMEIMRREVVVTTKFLDDLRSEMIGLDGNIDSQISVSANKIPLKKSSELENGKHEQAIQLSELQQENLLLSEQLRGLEEKLNHLTDEKESCYLELQTPESEDETIKRLHTEMEAQKVDMRLKMEDMQRRWSEVQEECEYLKIENLKLIDECNALEKANGELKKQSMELHERCLVWEGQLKESEKVYSNMLNKVDNLRNENQLLEEEISAQLQKKLCLQDELLALKETVNEAKFENEMLEASFTMLSRDYDELETETTLLVQKIFNRCKCREVSLEEAFGTQEALLENDLAHICREIYSQVDDKKNHETENPQFIGVELAEALEAKDMYEAHFKSLLSKEVSIQLDVPENSTGEVIAGKDRCECKVSTIEVEMSARYQIC